SLTFFSVQQNLGWFLVPLVVLDVLFFIVHAHILFRKDVRWRYRDYFRLAVLFHNGLKEEKAVADDRWKLAMNRARIEKASEYFEKHGIMICRRTESRIVFAVPQNMFTAVVLPCRSLGKYSSITVDSGGGLRVFISPEDYQRYQNVLSFEEFQAAFKNLFMVLMDLFREGAEKSILHMLDGSTGNKEEKIK
ncbi:MAG: hypothetical protein MUP70_00330, partial [Candidatus Aminicenantes bacterium]|nr:hypothetical protein [Candidatus Aminicenantes bacterium]